ncbi:MAG: FG-GAP repeat protein [Alphaproteobacteria bacterium]|nr:FG-GAP repeat protein [Alphaproteobacteria bacterium]
MRPLTAVPLALALATSCVPAGPAGGGDTSTADTPHDGGADSGDTGTAGSTDTDSGSSGDGSTSSDTGSADSGTDDTGTAPLDADGDGYSSVDDCDDSDPSVNPGSDEVCNDAVDNDCDGTSGDCTWVPADLGAADAVLLGSGAGQRAGSVAGVGDLNADGFDDLVVGVRYSDAAGDDAGTAYVVFGSATFGDSVVGSGGAAFFGEEAGDQAGYAVAAAGDVDGDGIADMVVGAYLQGLDDNGAAYLVLGSDTLSSTTLSGGAIKLTGAGPGHQAGHGVAGGGDTNGDGFDDVIVGARGADSLGFETGAAYLVLGSAGLASASLDTALEFAGEAAGDRAGYAVACVGDVDGDGLDDMVVGAIHRDATDEDDKTGAAYLILGELSPASRALADADQVLLGESPGDNAGFGVSGAGDVDGDGYDDSLVSARLSDRGGADSGAVYLIRGGLGSPPASLGDSDAIYWGAGSTSGDPTGVGMSLAGAGDTNGDGFDDVLIGAPGNDNGGPDAGSAYLILGSELPVSTALTSTSIELSGTAAGATAGAAVAGGDWNGDTYTDVAIAAPLDNTGGAEAGSVSVFFGVGL